MIKETRKNNSSSLFSKLKKYFINDWEKLGFFPVSTTYQRSTFGIPTQSGELDGKLWIYIERNKMKVKAIADFGIGTKGYSMDDVYAEEPKIEEFVDWALSTDKSIPLRDIVKEKYNSSFLNFAKLT